MYTSKPIKKNKCLFGSDRKKVVGHFVSFVYNLATGRVDLMDTLQTGLDNSAYYTRELLADFFTELHSSFVACNSSIPAPYLNEINLWNGELKNISINLIVTFRASIRAGVWSCKLGPSFDIYRHFRRQA